MLQEQKLEEFRNNPFFHTFERIMKDKFKILLINHKVFPFKYVVIMCCTEIFVGEKNEKANFAKLSPSSNLIRLT